MILSKDEEYWGYTRYRGRRGDAELNPIMARFQDFVRAEPEQFSGEADMLVHPTGTFQDPLGVLLHYPTPTTTSELRNGESGDRGSSCPQRIFEKGVTGSGCLWLDTYARRAKVPDRRDRDAGYVVPTDTWPEAQRTIHEDFSNYILESSKTKVLSVPSPIKKIAKTKKALTALETSV
ncbi:MAG: hypothetical protein M1830_002027 [Pleopsidium flavum]|nr:MAG: hypothetical protein M1830_002027 [Pleopsidium flavum]